MTRIKFLSATAVCLMVCACSSSGGDDEAPKLQLPTSPAAGATPPERTSDPAADGGQSPKPAGLTAADAVADRVDAFCTQYEACRPDAFKSWYRDLAECKALLSPRLAAELAAPATGATPEGFATCAKALRATSCTETPYDLGMPACKSQPGTLEANAPCAFGSQCKGGACLKDGKSVCGACGTPVAQGGACRGLFDCDGGLRCVDTKCQKVVGAGAACTVPGVACDTSLWCTGGKCASQQGKPCNGATGTGCPSYGFYCDFRSNTCKAEGWSAPNAACGYTDASYKASNACSAGSSCLYDTSGYYGTCTPARTEGQSCGPGSLCQAWLTCSSAGKCEATDAAKCK